jgi:hypothetical protein
MASRARQRRASGMSPHGSAAAKLDPGKLVRRTEPRSSTSRSAAHSPRSRRN